MASELEPTFFIQVLLDGDDDADMQTDNAETALKLALDGMQSDGYIRGYELTKQK